MDDKAKIDEYIIRFGDWRTQSLREVRDIINKNVNLKEEFKWMVPVWTANGLVCAISGFKDHVKINFFKGVYLPNSDNIFNSGLDSKEHRSINLKQDDPIPEAAITQLLEAAVAYNKGK